MAYGVNKMSRPRKPNLFDYQKKQEIARRIKAKEDFDAGFEKRKNEYCIKHNIDFDALLNRLKSYIESKKLSKTDSFYTAFDFTSEPQIIEVDINESTKDFDRALKRHTYKYNAALLVKTLSYILYCIWENDKHMPVSDLLDLKLSSEHKNIISKRISENVGLNFTDFLLKVNVLSRDSNENIEPSTFSKKRYTIMIYADSKTETKMVFDDLVLFSNLFENSCINPVLKEYDFLRIKKLKKSQREALPNEIHGKCLDEFILPKKESATEIQMKNTIFSRESF